MYWSVRDFWHVSIFYLFANITVEFCFHCRDEKCNYRRDCGDGSDEAEFRCPVKHCPDNDSTFECDEDDCFRIFHVCGELFLNDDITFFWSDVNVDKVVIFQVAPFDAPVIPKEWIAYILRMHHISGWRDYEAIRLPAEWMNVWNHMYSEIRFNLSLPIVYLFIDFNKNVSRISMFVVIQVTSELLSHICLENAWFSRRRRWLQFCEHWLLPG